MERPLEVTCNSDGTPSPEGTHRCIRIYPFSDEILEAHGYLAQKRDCGEIDYADPIIIKALSPATRTPQWNLLASQLGWDAHKDGLVTFHVFNMVGWYEDERYAGCYREIIFGKPYKADSDPCFINIRGRVFHHGKRVVISELEPISPNLPPASYGAYIEDWPRRGLSLIRCETLPASERKKSVDAINEYGWQVLAMNPILHNIGRKQGSTKIPLDTFRRLCLDAYCAYLEDNRRDGKTEPADWQIIDKIEELRGTPISERSFYRYMSKTFGSIQNLRAEAVQRLSESHKSQA